MRCTRGKAVDLFLTLMTRRVETGLLLGNLFVDCLDWQIFSPPLVEYLDLNLLLVAIGPVRFHHPHSENIYCGDYYGRAIDP